LIPFNARAVTVTQPEIWSAPAARDPSPVVEASGVLAKLCAFFDFRHAGEKV
jgi:hypothetical protein